MIGVPSPREGHFSDFSVLDGRNRFDDPGPTTALVPHLDDSLVLAGGGDQHFTFVKIMTAGLFDVNVLSGGAGEDGGRCVPMVGGGDRHGVYVTVFKHPAKVLDTLWFLQLLLSDC